MIAVDHQSIDYSRPLELLVRDHVFRREDTPEIDTEFPEIFFYSNRRYNKDPKIFLWEVINLGGLRRYLHILNIRGLEQTGLRVSYDEDDLLKSIQPRLLLNVATIRDQNGNFAKDIPLECYTTISLTPEEVEYVHFSSFGMERRLQQIFKPKLIGFASNYLKSK